MGSHIELWSCHCEAKLILSNSSIPDLALHYESFYDQDDLQRLLPGHQVRRTLCNAVQFWIRSNNKRPKVFNLTDFWVRTYLSILLLHFSSDLHVFNLKLYNSTSNFDLKIYNKWNNNLFCYIPMRYWSRQMQRFDFCIVTVAPASGKTRDPRLDIKFWI